MNKRSLILLPIAMLFLAGCNTTSTDSTPTPPSSSSSSSTTTVNYGTAESPLSVAEFNTEVAKLGLASGKFSTEHFFVKGYVLTDPTFYDKTSTYLVRLADSTASDATYINASGVKLATGVEAPCKNDVVVVKGLAELYNNKYSIWYTDTDSPELVKLTRGTSSVTPSIEHGTITGLESSYTNGATASFTVAAESGYYVKSVTANDEELTATDGTYSFTVAGDTTVKVTILEEGVTVNYGTAESPLSVAEFNTEAAKLGLADEEYSTEHFFVKGYVQNAVTWNASYGNYNKITIGTSKTSEDGVGVSGAKNGTGVTSLNQNDTIIVEGLAEAYNGSISIYFNKDKNDYPSVIKVELGTSTVTPSIEHGTITGLESSYTNGATASFAVTPDDGYKVASVGVSTEENALELVEDKYSFVVKGDATIKVTMMEDSIELGTVHTVVFNSKNNKDKVSSYEKTWTNTSDGITYTIVNMNNYNNGWEGYIKAGSKNFASVASISTTTLFSKQLLFASIDLQNINASYVNSIKLIVASDSAFETTVEEIAVTAAKGVQTVRISNSTESCYYKFELDLKQGTGNGFVQIGNLTFTEAA